MSNKTLITLNLCFSAMKKHGAGLCSLLKRLVFAFNKDSADLLSALLDFLRQILNTETMVSTWFYGWFMFHMEVYICICYSVSSVKATVEMIVSKMEAIRIQLTIIIKSAISINSMGLNW